MGLENLRRMYEPIPVWTLGDRLRKIRRDNAGGMTQKDFAESIGVGGPAYTAWEGDRSVPREPDDLAERIRYVWGVPKWWTLGKEPPHSGPRKLPRRDSNQQSSDYWTHCSTQPRRHHVQLPATARHAVRFPSEEVGAAVVHRSARRVDRGGCRDGRQRYRADVSRAGAPNGRSRYACR